MTCNRNIIHNVGHIKLAGRGTLKNRTLHQRTNHFPNGKSFPPLPLIHITCWPASMIDSDKPKLCIGPTDSEGKPPQPKFLTPKPKQTSPTSLILMVVGGVGI